MENIENKNSDFSKPAYACLGGFATNQRFLEQYWIE